MVYNINAIWEIDLESEVEAWLSALPHDHYQRVMRNADDYLTTGGVPDGHHVKKLQDADGLYELRVALDRTTWRITFWKPGGLLIILLTVFQKTRDGVQRADVDRAIQAMKNCHAKHDRTITHDFERNE
jgi:putative component of toxin-antitoxin plasmid stabilization module